MSGLGGIPPLTVSKMMELALDNHEWLERRKLADQRQIRQQYYKPVIMYYPNMGWWVVHDRN